MFCMAKLAKKLFLWGGGAILDHFQTKMFKSETTFFHYFFQGFQISKNIGHPTSGSGGKTTFKQYLKSEHKDRRTDKSTYRKHQHQYLFGYRFLVKTQLHFGDILILILLAYCPPNQSYFHSVIVYCICIVYLY